MDNMSDTEIEQAIASLKHGTFKNQEGEAFHIYTNGVLTFMAGDEVDAMVEDKYKLAGKYIPLFNNHFNMWSNDELYSLGEVLQELTQEKKA